MARKNRFPAGDTSRQPARACGKGFSPATLTIFLISLFSPASNAAGGIDDIINTTVQPLTNVLSSVVFFTVPLFNVDVPLVVVWLVFAATYFTLYFNFLNIRGFKHAIGDWFSGVKQTIKISDNHRLNTKTGYLSKLERLASET